MLLSVKNIPGACIHSTRHTFASVCYYADIPDKKIQKWLGNATIAMTLDTYTDLFDDGTSVILEYIKKLAK